MTIIVAIAGFSGSGKSTIAERIQAHYGMENCEIISSDFYYKGFCPNYDIPDAYEFDFLQRQLDEYVKMKDDDIIKLPQYDFTIHARKPVTLDVPRKKIVLIDGILILFVEELKNLFDLKIAVDIHPARSALFRLNRDIKDRKRTFEGAHHQYLTTVLPAQIEFVEPSLKSADLKIDNNGALELINIRPAIEQIDALLAKQEKKVKEVTARTSVYASNITTFPQAAAQASSSSLPVDVAELALKDTLQVQLGR